LNALPLRILFTASSDSSTLFTAQFILIPFKFEERYSLPDSTEFWFQNNKSSMLEKKIYLSEITYVFKHQTDIMATK